MGNDAEQEPRAAERMAGDLRDAERLKRELVALVSHEFRTPLAAIVGLARTLRARHDSMDGATAEACTRALEHEANRLNRIVTNLLAVSTEFEVDLAGRADLATAARDALDVVEHADAEGARRVRLDVPDGLAVAMSPDGLRHVLVNLLENAVKFAEPDTGVSVRAAQRGKEIIFEVANVGPAIPPHEREHIFEPFVQLDSSDTRRHGGLGLGLHVVRRLVHAHGGTVTVGGDGREIVFAVRLRCADVASSTARFALV